MLPRSEISAESLLSAPRAGLRQVGGGPGALFWDAETVSGAFFGVLEFTLIFLIKIDAKWEPFGSSFWKTFSLFRALSSDSYFLCFWEPLSRRL